jgi:uncharacterized protein YndB with AHSA1/START domain
VFEVVSRAEHIAEWWSDAAELDPAPGGTGFVAFGDLEAGGQRVEITVDEVVPGHLFAFRWAYADGAYAGPGNSNLVTFELSPEGSGTRLRFTETGFTGRDLDDTTARAMHADHSSGWDYFLPKLGAYAPGVG